MNRGVESLIHAVPQMVGQLIDSRRRLELLGDYDRIYLHHIRKTGGTSVTNAFLALGGESAEEVERRLLRLRPRITRTGDVVIAAHDRPALQTGGYGYGWSHIPSWRIRLRPRTYTVTVLRDPMSRVISLFKYLTDPDSDRGHAFGASQTERAMAAHGFDEFLTSIPKTDLLNHVHMFSQPLDPAEAAARISACSLVFFIDQMNDGMAALSNLVGRPLRASVDRKSSSQFHPSDAQRDRLRELLSPEYQLVDMLRA